MGIGATAGVAAVGGIALTAQASSETSSSSSGSSGAAGGLAFDPDGYTKLTTTITGADLKDHEVTYHFWKAITYVSKPVDEEYQSLTVSVPVEIDGKAVDASDAPIVVSNVIAGYMPSSVADATAIGGAVGSGAPPAGGAGGASASASPSPSASASASPEPGGGGAAALPKMALLSGYVVVEPGARGRSLTNSEGEYYGTAPAGIVDLKAAVRYVRANRGVIPGNVDRIVSAGVSAGGALSALLGSSVNIPAYDKYLKEIGAADADDTVFASADWCPIADLEHADGAYEWNWGSNVTQTTGKVVDQTVSKELSAQFAEYQASLKLRGMDGFGKLTARNFDEYLLEKFIRPSATTYLKALTDSERETYLAAHTNIGWDGEQATFTWSQYLAHVGARKKTAPAFDAFDLSAGENNEFGKGTTEARHFTAYGLKGDTTGVTATRVDSDIPAKLHLMNPMHYIVDEPNSQRAKHWWIRLGTKDTDTALTVSANLATALDNLGDDVNYLFYWDQGHGANIDLGDFVAWIADISGYKGKSGKRSTK
ncbi:subtype B tannase [Streptomyces justiciae]|uniref:Subtype B tannase n=1 Tax=Streptomyces justiciae TaxID=2780140 RepID=A0ABU3M892_9ACTN|nr:subtype B tannase [Streptomyces justiciae]MDT7847271.1 subtype B tannase [Streptomyces justiciae]